MSYFEQLGLAEPIVRALAKKGYADPTPIQKQAIPALLEGRDLCGIAQTGTGKTAAFSLPSLHHLASQNRNRPFKGCRMLVLSPTRELAAQIAENMRGYARNLRLSVEAVFGGVPINRQIRKLAAGTDVLVATPGRLLDLIEQRALQLNDVEIFVLDEADQMMDLGFIVPLKRIDKLLPKQRQSLFFSATMPKAIADLGARFLNDPVTVEVTPPATTAERVEQHITYINQKEKQALLTLKLREWDVERALVFTRTKHGADRVVRHLVGAGLTAAAIHGNKSQAQRTTALQGFRDGRVKILVATDIAARGIDVSGVSHVINYEIPNVPEQYVHRIGRTARAGADGQAFSFAAPDEKVYIRDIQRLTDVRMTPMPLPEGFLEAAAALPGPAKMEKDPAPRGRGGRRDARRDDPRDSRRDGRRSGNRHGRPARTISDHRTDQGEKRSSYDPTAYREKDAVETRERAPRGERSGAGSRRDNRHSNDGSRGKPHGQKRNFNRQNENGRNDNRRDEPQSDGERQRRGSPRRDDRGNAASGEQRSNNRRDDQRKPHGERKHNRKPDGKKVGGNSDKPYRGKKHNSGKSSENRGGNTPMRRRSGSHGSGTRP
ncbi:MAG: DEAD/DEAH box helicase [Pseudomonadota bacterium]